MVCLAVGDERLRNRWLVELGLACRRKGSLGFGESPRDRIAKDRIQDVNEGSSRVLAMKLMGMGDWNGGKNQAGSDLEAKDILEFCCEM